MPSPPTPMLTERLRLDPLGSLDIEAFMRLHSEAKVTEYLSPARALSPAESFRLLCQIVGHMALKGFGYWAVRRQDDEAWLGMVGLWSPEGWPGVELGWRFLPEYWGQGYATEAASAVRDMAYATLGMKDLLSIIHSENSRSQRLAVRLGMHKWQTRNVGEAPLIVYRWSATP